MNNEFICTKIKELRKRRNLSQAELAELLGYNDHSIISKYEKGVHKVPYSTLLQLADIFKVSPNYLMGYESYSIDTDALLQKGFDISLASQLTKTQTSMVNAYMKALIDSKTF